MKAIIPVAGYGTRLMPHTKRYQKTLLPIAGKPALDFILDPLFNSGINEIIFIVGHLKEQVIDHMKKYDGNFSFIEQKVRLGLGHAILTGLANTDEPVLIQLGDTIFDIDYHKFIDSQVNIIGVDEVEDPTRFGIVELKNDKIINFYEKHPKPPSNLAISGLYYFTDEGKLKSAIEELIKLDIRTNNEYQITDALQLMVKQGEDFGVFPTPNYYDVGVPEAILYSNRKLLFSNHIDFSSSKIIEPVFIGNNCKLDNSIIGPYVTIMENCIVQNSKVEDSIILENSNIIDKQIISKIAAKDGNEFC
ncbi:MAG: sugar phosphate nucleotidyltransferase [Candidatus Marinimicrobia bacterium]|nr:sugar phosphate nucleotidyltransferase [Candidatus Neomarinimicrobiota bacterium]